MTMRGWAREMGGGRLEPPTSRLSADDCCHFVPRGYESMLDDIVAKLSTMPDARRAR